MRKMGKQKVKKSTLEDGFETLLKYNDIDGYIRNYRQVVPKRRYELDFAWPELKVGIEIQGGVWLHRSGHTRAGQVADYRKLNLATVYGWRVLQFSTDMLRRDPQGCIEQLKQLLNGGNGTEGVGSR